MRTNARETHMWVFRDPDGSYWASEREPKKYHNGRERVWGTSDGWLVEWRGPLAPPTLRKGTKARVFATIEVTTN